MLTLFLMGLLIKWFFNIDNFSTDTQGIILAICTASDLNLLIRLFRE